MNYAEALDYIESVGYFDAEPSLERIGALMDKLGNPHKALKFVHIAGTNGKGSAAVMTAGILKSAGYRTGLFTSPYIYRFNERIMINGEEIGNEELALVVKKLKAAAGSLDVKPTQFELMTAAALLWFKESACDVVVLEVGLGGRFDATNIIDAPEAAVIMNIGLDHTEHLGHTVEEIAFEKAGIIKSGTEVVLYEQSESVTDVVKARCDELGAKLHIADFSQIKPEFDSLCGQSFTYKNQPFALSLLGAHQLKNAAVVAELAEVLKTKGWNIDQSDVEHGLYAASWPGRFELVCDEPEFIVDGGHNPQCAQSIRDNLLHYFPGKRRIMLLGVLKGKDLAALADILNQAADEYVCITPDSDRAVPAAELAKALEKYGKKITVAESLADGIESAMEAAGSDGMVCAAGSLYNVGGIREYFGLY